MSRLPAAQRREQLLDRAAELFAQHGYARATTAELAKAAGVTEPIIYRHFKSKRDLFIALIERTGDETLASWEAALQDASSPADRLSRLIAGNPMTTPKGQVAYRVILQAITETHDESICQALQAHVQKLHDFLEREVARAQELHKVTGRCSAELVAWILIDVGLGFGVLTAWGIEGHGRDRAGAHVQDAIRRMVVGREAKPPEGEKRPG